MGMTQVSSYELNGVVIYINDVILQIRIPGESAGVNRGQELGKRSMQ